MLILAFSALFTQLVPLHTGDKRLFGEIVHISSECDKKEVLLFVQILSVECFEDHYYAYLIDKKTVFEMVSIIYNTADIRPVSLLSCFQGFKFT